MDARRAAVATAVLLLTSASVPATAAVDRDASSLRARLEAVRADVARTRTALVGGRLADAVSAAAALAGQTPMAIASPPAVHAPAVPAPIRPAIARLVAAVRAADAGARAALLADPSSVDTAHRRLMDAIAEASLDGTVASMRRVPDVSVLEGLVDRRRLYGAARHLAATIDEALPVLARAPRLAPPARGAACDLVDQAPHLCIGGHGENRYDAEYELIVDLGGDDRYYNSAGGANVVYTGIAVAVVLDLGGDDRYETEIPTPQGARAVQGAAGVGGIGILVDQEGDDRYDASTMARSESLFGQGSAVAGVGILADASGNDDYRLRIPAPAAGGFAYRSAQGIGAGGLGGMGLLLDGGGDDGYLVEAAPSPEGDAESVALSSARAQGFGNGVGGSVGIFRDAGGRDTAALVATAGPLDPGDPRTVVGGSAAMWGVGYGAAGGTGVALTGPGSMTWSADASVRATSSGEGPISPSAASASFVYGVGLTGGVGAVTDDGGGDRYVMDARTTVARHRALEDGCGCSAVDVELVALGSIGQGLGYGQLGGIGLVDDRGGDDAYVSTAVSEAEAIAIDRRGAEPPAGDAGTLDVSAFSGLAISRMGGIGFAGAGAIHDTGGDDVYESMTRSQAGAEARSPYARVTRRSTATAGRAHSLAQAGGDVGYSELVDVGGRDRYASENRSIAATEPGTATTTGEEDTSVQGSVETGAVAVFTDLDGGAEDVFVAIPADPACVGTRGREAWVDCGAGVGIGTVA